jgi:hypothetical protein
MSDVFAAAPHIYQWAGNVFAFPVVALLVWWVFEQKIAKLFNNLVGFVIVVIAFIAALLSILVGFLSWIGMTIGMLLNVVSLSSTSWMIFYGGGALMVLALALLLIGDTPLFRYTWVNKGHLIYGQGLDETLVYIGIIVGAIGWVLINLSF